MYDGSKVAQGCGCLTVPSEAYLHPAICLMHIHPSLTAHWVGTPHGWQGTVPVDILHLHISIPSQRLQHPVGRSPMPTMCNPQQGMDCDYQ